MSGSAAHAKGADMGIGRRGVSALPSVSRSRKVRSFRSGKGGDPLNLAMTATLIELGDATSRNLEFSHRSDVWVSYGEETITETNLLEIRRRHPEQVRVRTFPKRVEGQNGADWEWHIIGRELTLKMRVQAKRLQCNDVLKIKHVVKSSGAQQRDLLIAGARAAGMKPVYCIYCTEDQRRFWTERRQLRWCGGFQTGCLLADATDVPLTAGRLGQIERKCKPWHHLFGRSVFIRGRRRWFPEFLEADENYLMQFVTVRRPRVPVVADGDATDRPESSGWNAPTIDDLNEDAGREFDRIGVEETSREDLERLDPESDAGRWRAESDRERLHDLGIYRMMVMDVRGREPEFEERDERRRD